MIRKVINVSSFPVYLTDSEAEKICNVLSYCTAVLSDKKGYGPEAGENPYAHSVKSLTEINNKIAEARSRAAEGGVEPC